MNTRVAVPLSKEAYDAVSLICKMSGVSRGKFLADTLEAAIPGFIKIAEAFRAAEAVQGDEREAILSGMLAAERRLLSVLDEVSLLDLMEPDGPPPSPAPKGGRGDGGGPSDPRILTGGFQPPTKGGQNEI